MEDILCRLDQIHYLCMRNTVGEQTAEGNQGNSRCRLIHIDYTWQQVSEL